MKTRHLGKSPMASLTNQRGVAAVMVALTLVVLLAITAAAIDIGHALVARNELQNAADAAALAGARRLGVIYQEMSQLTGSLSGVLLPGDKADEVRAAAMTAAVANAAAGVNITLDPADICIGYWYPISKQCSQTPPPSQWFPAPPPPPPTAVQVITRRDGTANGAVSTFLAGVIGVMSINVNAIATAELTPVGQVAPGQMDAPFAISEYFFNSGLGCGSTIQFSPSNGTPESCAGWTTYDQQFNNPNVVSEIKGMINGTWSAPPAQSGETQIYMGNGNLGNQGWTALKNLWQAKAAASDDGTWHSFVPVYGGSDCQPGGGAPFTVIGFSTVQITYVGGPGDPNNALNCTGSNVSPGCIVGVVECDVFNGAGGGGTPFGTFGSIPGLVQ